MWKATHDELLRQYVEFEANSKEMEEALEDEVQHLTNAEAEARRGHQKALAELAAMKEQEATSRKAAGQKRANFTERISALELTVKNLKLLVQGLEQNKDELERAQRILLAENEGQAEQLENAMEDLVLLREELEDALADAKTTEKSTEPEDEASSAAAGRLETAVNGEKAAHEAVNSLKDEKEFLLTRIKEQSDSNRVLTDNCADISAEFLKAIGDLEAKFSQVEAENHELRQVLAKAEVRPPNLNIVQEEGSFDLHEDQLESLQRFKSRLSTSTSQRPSPDRHSFSQMGSAPPPDPQKLVSKVKALQLNVEAQRRRLALLEEQTHKDAEELQRLRRPDLAQREEARTTCEAPGCLSPRQTATDRDSVYCSVHTKPPIHRLLAATETPTGTPTSSTHGLVSPKAHHVSKFVGSAASDLVGLQRPANVGNEGFLRKLSGRRAQWNEGYFILDARDHILEHYHINKKSKGKSKVTRMGSIRLAGALLELYDIAKYGVPNTIGITPLYSKKTQVLMCRDEADLSAWVESLETHLGEKLFAESVKEGFLYQESAEDNAWVPRYTVLNTNSLQLRAKLMDKTQNKLVDGMDLSGGALIKKEGDFQLRVIPFRSPHTVTLRSNTTADRDRWVNTLQDLLKPIDSWGMIDEVQAPKEDIRVYLKFESSGKIIPMKVPMDGLVGDLQRLIMERHSTGVMAKERLPDTERCTVCQSRFGVMNRRFHCKNCGQNVCGNCSMFRVPVKVLGNTEARVCDRCYVSGRPTEEWAVAKFGTVHFQDEEEEADETSVLLVIGDHVACRTDEGIATGTIRYLGETVLGTGKWIGVELLASMGNCNGTVQDIMYFQAAPKRGVFLRKHDVQCIAGNGSQSGQPQVSVELEWHGQALVSTLPIGAYSLGPGAVLHAVFHVAYLHRKTRPNLQRAATADGRRGRNKGQVTLFDFLASDSEGEGGDTKPNNKGDSEAMGDEMPLTRMTERSESVPANFRKRGDEAERQSRPRTNERPARSGSSSHRSSRSSSRSRSTARRRSDNMGSATASARGSYTEEEDREGPRRERKGSMKVKMSRLSKARQERERLKELLRKAEQQAKDALECARKEKEQLQMQLEQREQEHLEKEAEIQREREDKEKLRTTLEDQVLETQRESQKAQAVAAEFRKQTAEELEAARLEKQRLEDALEAERATRNKESVEQQRQLEVLRQEREAARQAQEEYEEKERERQLRIEKWKQEREEERDKEKAEERKRLQTLADDLQKKQENEEREIREEQQARARIAERERKEEEENRKEREQEEERQKQEVVQPESPPLRGRRGSNRNSRSSRSRSRGSTTSRSRKASRGRGSEVSADNDATPKKAKPKRSRRSGKRPSFIQKLKMFASGSKASEDRHSPLPVNDDHPPSRIPKLSPHAENGKPKEFTYSVTRGIEGDASSTRSRGGKVSRQLLYAQSSGKRISASSTNLSPAKSGAMSASAAKAFHVSAIRAMSSNDLRLESRIQPPSPALKGGKLAALRERFETKGTRKIEGSLYAMELKTGKTSWHRRTVIAHDDQITIQKTRGTPVEVSLANVEVFCHNTSVLGKSFCFSVVLPAGSPGQLAGVAFAALSDDDRRNWLRCVCAGARTEATLTKSMPKYM